MSTFSRWTSLADAPPPDAAVEIAAHRVSAISLETGAGKPVVAAHAAEALPEGALVPSLTGLNARDVHARAAIVAALKRVLESVGRPRRVGLVVPDPIAKVSLVRFAQVPARASELDQLIRWQVRKAAPFPIEEAQITWARGIRVAGAEAGEAGQEFLVSMARREVVVEYEALCAAAGAHAGIVDISTFNVINAVTAGATPTPADWLLVNVASDYASIAIMRGPHLILFRSRGADSEGTLADLVHQTAMYYEDRLQGSGFGRVLLSGASAAGAHAADIDELRRGLQERLATTVETVDPRSAVGLVDRITASPAFLDMVTPLVGVLLRDSNEAAA